MNEQASPDHIGDRLRGGAQGSALSKDTYGCPDCALAFAAWMLASWALRPFWRSGPTARVQGR